MSEDHKPSKKEPKQSLSSTIKSKGQKIKSLQPFVRDCLNLKKKFEEGLGPLYVPLQ